MDDGGWGLQNRWQNHVMLDKLLYDPYLTCMRLHYYQNILDLENQEMIVCYKLTNSLKGSLFIDKLESCCVWVLEEER